jgi:hypothetical protein
MMGQRPQNERVVAVFPDEHAAEEAAQAARAAGAEEVLQGASQDEVTVLQSEMREEAAEARPGFFTPQMVRSVPLWTAIAAIVGVVVALPVGFTGTDDVPLATHLLIAACFGGAIGGTIGFFFAVMAIGFARRRAEPMAAERGVVVGAEGDAGTAARTLGARNPIRVDKTAPRQPEPD